MRLSQELITRPVQRLVVTPELRQALEALQLGVLELSAYLRPHLEANPFLETADDEEPREPEPQGFDAAGDDDPWEPPEPSCPPPEPAERLWEEFRLEVADPVLRRAARYLTGSLDANGYLRVSTREAAEDLGIAEDRVSEALRQLQALEPGIAATDLRECLLLQIGDRDPLLRVLVEEHLADVVAGHSRAVAERLGLEVAEVCRALERLRELEPKPGRAWASPDAGHVVVPDLTFRRVEDAFVVLVEEPTPRIRLNPLYRRWLSEGQAAKDAELRRYLEGRLHAAMWVLRCLEQRRMTLYRLGEALLECQREFFRRGPRHLRSLTMREVADMMGVHESTVSRAAARKHAATPHGAFPLRAFFSSGVECRGAEALSAESIKRRIRDLVAAEEPERPLSDQELAIALQRAGILIARRTVSKYRQELGLAPSAVRRRHRREA